MALSKENKWGFPSGADKPLVLLAKEGPLYILTLQNVTADNWFTSAFMKAVTEALDKVLQDLPEKEPAALITTGHNPKIYSNGLALEEAFQNGQAYFAEYMTLVQKMLVFPIPTVAALNGHAFAGGCMFSLAHDYRVMRGDRGFICLVRYIMCFGLYLRVTRVKWHDRMKSISLLL